MSDLADDLRAKAGGLFHDLHPRATPQTRNERVVAEIPSGFDTLLRFAWSAHSGLDELTIRGYRRAPDGQLFALAGFGLNLRPSQLLGFASAIGDALDQLQVTDRGLQIRAAPPCADDDRKAAAPPPRLAFGPGRRDR